MITVNTTTPKGLLKNIYDAIDDKTIATWSYDSDKDFTHTPDQWKKKAFLRPKIKEQEKLILSLVWLEGSTKDKAVAGVFQGRFIEMLCTHFGSSFSTIDVTVP